MGRLWRVAVVCAAALALCSADAQVIEFESGGLRYQALTKDGLTIMVAPLPTHVREYTVLQVAIQNGGKSSYVIRPEDFLYQPDPATEISASSGANRRQFPHRPG